jgi:hypothetical protein
MTANLSKLSAPILADDASGHAHKIGVFTAGEVIPVASPVYIHSDGKIYKSVSSACTISNIAKFDGFVIDGCASGEVVTVWGIGTRVKVVASGLVIGTYQWVSATAGAISDTKVASADLPISKAVSATEIRVIRLPL